MGFGVNKRCSKTFFLKRIKEIVLNVIYKFNRTTIPFGLFDEGVNFSFPSQITVPQNVFLHKFSRLQGGHKIINYTGKFIMKEYSAAARNLTVVTGNHTPTVGIPQYLLGPSHINDKENDVIVEEDVWIGTNVTLLSNITIGRGAIIGACSLVNKNIPPYAIVAGIPAKIIGVKFSKNQILEHERILYPPQMRLTEKYLDDLFVRYYNNMKVIGTSTINDEDKIKLSKTIKRMKFHYINENDYNI